MLESQILTAPEKEAKKGEPFTQIEYVIKENEIITYEKENICTPPGTKSTTNQNKELENLLRLTMY